MGEFADGANALLYLAEGDYANAALSAAAMIPIAGGAATAARMCKKFCDSAVSAVAKGAKEVGASAVKRVKNKLGRACNSFVPGTLVLLASGALVPIEAVVVGDEVLATDPVTGESASERVTATITGEGVKTLVEISVEGEIVVATDEHPFWEVSTGSWVDAVDLEPGNVLVDAGGAEVVVASVAVATVVDQAVHNLTVEDTHTYYVGQSQILNHNTACEVGSYSKVGGHHIHAKAAFSNVTSYSKGRSLAISQDAMRRAGIDHAQITRKQRELFDELASSGRSSTMREHSRIAVESLVAGGARRAQARRLVAQSLSNLRSQGIRKPGRIPWN